MYGGKAWWIIGDSDIYLFVPVLGRVYYQITVIFQLFPNSVDLPHRCQRALSCSSTKQINTFNSGRVNEKYPPAKLRRVLSIICVKKKFVYRGIPPIGKYRGMCTSKVGLSLWEKTIFFPNLRLNLIVLCFIIIFQINWFVFFFNINI